MRDTWDELTETRVASRESTEIAYWTVATGRRSAGRADTLTSADQLRAQLRRLEEAGCTDVVLYSCSGDLAQVSLLAAPLRTDNDTRC